MGISCSDFRIFFNRKDRSWIIANDFKYRILINKGYSKQSAKDLSHGHLSSKKTAEAVKNNILSNRRTKSREIRTLGCYKRVASNKCYRHYNWVCGLYDSKTNKGKQKQYTNINKGIKK